jgi:hypothetical protein
MPVSTGIIRDPNGSTVIALIQVPSQLRGTADLDGPHDTEMSNRHLMSLSISRSKSPEDIGHF